METPVATSSGPASPRTLPAVRRGLTALAVVLVVALAVAAPLFITSSRAVTLASHDAVIRPTFDGEVVLRTGPLLPDVRFADRADLGVPVGVRIELGKTEAASTSALATRYAFIASQPDAQRHVVQDAVTDMAVAALLRGLAAGVVVVGVWVLLGPRRRAEVWAGVRSRRGVAGLGVAVLVLVAAWQPWDRDPRRLERDDQWQTLGTFLGSEVPLPAEAARLEVSVDSGVSSQTRSLVANAVDTWERSRAFYTRARQDAAELDLRQPREAETVALVVSDRHDNIGMDPVARAVGDAGGATAVIDGGDDTSNGKSWEAFSLASLQEAFGDLERYGVAGNHDSGTFVQDYLDARGWIMMDGEVVDGPGASRMLGVPDPRSSGFGSLRRERELSFGEQSDLLADAACEADARGERVSTLLVHDTNQGRPALERGCVDLVLGGHLHVTVGPVPTRGEGGRVGWTFINGTTGGAAYAIAVGSKIRRTAAMSLVTYRDGRPVGVQDVALRTDGVFEVGDFTELTYGAAAPDVPGDPGPRPGEPNLDPDLGRGEAPGQQFGPGTTLSPSP